AERLAAIRAGIEALIATAARGRIYREGARLAIVGRPNVGKSRLPNAPLREEPANVTPTAGTTRAAIAAAAHLPGSPLTHTDTEGLRETADLVEQIGVERARAALETAALVLFVLDASAGWTPEDAAIAAQIADRRAVWIVNKVDLVMEARVAALIAALSTQAG